jgi:hypothetical protein
MRQFVWFIYAWLILGLASVEASVISIVKGAEGSGAVNLAFGDYVIQDGLNSSNPYGYAAVSVDENFLTHSYEDFYPEQLSGLSGPVVASMNVELDMSVADTLKIFAGSKILDTNALIGARNNHRGIVTFGILEDADVVVHFNGTSTASAVLRDPFGTIWTNGNGTNTFSLSIGTYSLEYSMYTEFEPMSSAILDENLELLFSFTPAGLPGASPPSPPPGSDQVPEPSSCVILGAFLKAPIEIPRE